MTNITRVISPLTTGNIFVFPCLALVQIMLWVFLNIFFGAQRREFLLVLLDHRLYPLTLPLDVRVHPSCSTLGIIRPFHLSSLWEYNITSLWFNFHFSLILRTFHTYCQTNIFFCELPVQVFCLWLAEGKTERRVWLWLVYSFLYIF